MLIDVKCPQCRDSIPVSESIGEQKIDCPACGENFTVPGAGKTRPKPPANEKSKSGSKSKDDEKKPSTRRSRRDDDDDDDDDGRPRRREESGAKGGMIGILVLGGVGLLVLLVGFGFVAYLIFSKSDEPEVANNANDNAAPGETRPAPQLDKTGTPPRGNDPDDLPPRPGPTGNTGPNKTPKEPKETRPKKSDPIAPATPTTATPNAAPPAPAIALPAPADKLVVGAGGKLLFLHLKSTRQVAVFDPAAAKIVKYIPVEADDELLLAAGLTHLFVGYPKSKRIERHLLTTYEMDKWMEAPTKFPLHGLAIGAASSGPLLAAAGNFPNGEELFLIDAIKMQRVAGTAIKNPGIFPDSAMQMWASHDGRTFTATSGGLSRPHIYRIHPSGWSVHASPCNPPLPGADGETVFGNGVMANADGQAIGENRSSHGKAVWYAPAAQGPFFVSANERTFGEWPKEKKSLELQLHAGRDPKPLLVFPELPETADFADFFFGKVKPLDQHVIYLPFANVLAILPAARDRIHLRTVDLKAELAKSKSDYLVVVSRPSAATAGSTFKYTPEIWSKKGGVKLRLEAMPKGMNLEGDTLVWDVPAKFAGGPTNVILTVSDASGQETFHTFDVAVFPR